MAELDGNSSELLIYMKHTVFLSIVVPLFLCNKISPRPFADTDEWHRFRLYAPFVRRLILFKSEGHYYRLYGWKFLFAQSINAPLLPNLRAVDFNVRTTTTMFEQLAWFHLFMTPSIRELHIKASYRQHRRQNEWNERHYLVCMPRMLGTKHQLGGKDQRALPMSVSSFFLESLVACLPSSHIAPSRSILPLPEHEIAASSFGEYLNGSRWFESLPDLTGLCDLAIPVSALGTKGLYILGLLPLLKRLELAFPMGENEPSKPTLTLPANSFPCLHHLRLTQLSDFSFVQDIWGLPAMVSKLTSAEFRFYVTNWAAVSALKADRFMSEVLTVITERSPRIVDLSIYPPYLSAGMENSVPILHLISRLPLRRLRFAPIAPFRLYFNPNEATYPTLRHLELTSSWVELPDLRALAKMLPKLEWLAINRVEIPTMHLANAQSTQYQALQPITIRVRSVRLQESQEWGRTEYRDEFVWLVVTPFYLCAEFYIRS